MLRWSTGLLILLSLLLTACQSENTPLSAQMPPFITPDTPYSIAGVPLYPGAIEIKGSRFRYTNRLTSSYLANAEPETIIDTLKQLLLENGFEAVNSNQRSKSEQLLVGRKPQVVALITIINRQSRPETAQSSISYTLLLRSSGPVNLIKPKA